MYFCDATDSLQYRLPNATQEASNTSHFGYVSDSLSRQRHFFRDTQTAGDDFQPSNHGVLWLSVSIRVRVWVMVRVRAWGNVRVRVMVGIMVSMV